MNIIGIIAEYNPFHNGHLYQINKIKELYPNSLIIVVLNGNFTQRGDVSVINKWDKTSIILEHNVDLVIVDTAGRLQTKANLMSELAKIKRVIGKDIPNAPHETFLVIDATTGQNGVIQAKAFAEVTNLTGVVITKMDGTSKGGIILAIRDELSVPVRFIGLGEKMEDLEEFDLDKYLYGLCVVE